MKNSNVIIAIVVASLSGQTQTGGFGDYYVRQAQEEQRLQEGKQALIATGVGAVTLAGIVAAANFYTRFFPTAPETKNINRREYALDTLRDVEHKLKTLLGDMTGIPNEPYQGYLGFAIRKDNLLKEESNKKIITDMVELITKLKNQIGEDIKKDTEKLRRRTEKKKGRSWKEWWQGKWNTEKIRD